jgi:glycosyltransferase involved in cell wall biosynthesis
MIIVHIAEAFAGGISTFLKLLIENMPHDRHVIIHGERPQVAKFEDIRKDFNYPNVEFIRWNSAQRSIHPIKDTKAFAELYKILRPFRKTGVDAIHLHSSKSGFIGRMVCNVLRFPNVIYTPNGAPFMVGKSVFSNTMYKALEKLGSAFGGKVVCCSESERVAYAKAGIKAVTINNGINLTKEPDHISTYIDSSKFRIAFSGRVLDQKNPALFNRIASYFVDLPQFEFIWVGDGPDVKMLKSPNIRITGWLPQHEAKQIIKASHIYLSTAKFEGLSFSVLEALAMKKPVLLTDCIGNCDMIKDGLNGDLYRDAKDAINKILRYYNNMDMLSIMGHNSMQYCYDEFDIKHTQSQYRSLYEGAPISQQ